MEERAMVAGRRKEQVTRRENSSMARAGEEQLKRSNKLTNTVLNEIKQSINAIIRLPAAVGW